mmetsp:Transcript_28463/g.65992  ORF Transcript_28463/g.65992 Transcript_28463/m.65992 type:complete len:221 (+) Transcript_28463:1737-2399(+)
MALRNGDERGLPPWPRLCPYCQGPALVWSAGSRQTRSSHRRIARAQTPEVDLHLARSVWRHCPPEKQQPRPPLRRVEYPIPPQPNSHQHRRCKERARRPNDRNEPPISVARDPPRCPRLDLFWRGSGESPPRQCFHWLRDEAWWTHPLCAPEDLPLALAAPSRCGHAHSGPPSPRLWSHHTPCNHQACSPHLLPLEGSPSHLSGCIHKRRNLCPCLGHGR